jgi:hypothetical protein
MIKTNLLKASALALAVLSSTGADAQTVVWGVGSGNAAELPIAEFQTPFVQGTDPFALVDTAWNAIAVNEGTGTPAGTVTPGNAYWIQTTGTSRGNFSSGRTIGAAAGSGSIPAGAPNSVANGVAMFDSDFMDNAGLPNNFGNGTSPSQHIGQLISPPIDLSGYTDSALVLKVNTHWLQFQSTCNVGMSIDNGATWTDVNIAPILPTNVNTSSEGRISIPFYNITNSVANLTQCRVRFSFDGEYYVWVLDDVSIETISGSDFSIRREDPTGNNLAAALVDVKVGMNRYIPSNLLDPTNLKEWFWGASVINYGPTTISPLGTNPTLYMSIDYVDPVTGAVTPGVYLDTIVIQSPLNGGGATQVDTAKSLRDLDFICNPNPSIGNGVGDYNVTYWVSHSGTDSDPLNDTTRHTFTITDAASATSNYLSKVRLNQNGQPFVSAATFPGDPVVSEFEYGSMFYFFRGATDTVTIDSIDFRYFITNGYTGSSSQTVVVNVYQWNDADANGTLAAGTAQGNPELTSVALGTYTANGLGIVGMHEAGTYELGRVNNLLNPVTGLPAGAIYADDGFYLVTIQQNPALSGGTTMTADDGLWIGRDVLNYAMNSIFTGGANPLPNVSPAKIIDGGGTGDWNWVGFGANEVPSIGLYVSAVENKLGVNTATVYADEGMGLSVFPNPTSDVLNVALELEEAADVTYIVTDITGRVINMATQSNVTEATSTLDVSSLAGGVYFITAQTAEGKQATQRFVKK